MSRMTNCPHCGHCLLPTTEQNRILLEMRMRLKIGQAIRAYEASMEGENRNA